MLNSSTMYFYLLCRYSICTISKAISNDARFKWELPKRDFLNMYFSIFLTIYTSQKKTLFLQDLFRQLLLILCLFYYTILYYTILYYTILYFTILYYTILHYTILYYTILYYTMLFYYWGKSSCYAQWKLVLESKIKQFYRPISAINAFDKSRRLLWISCCWFCIYLKRLLFRNTFR